MGRCRLVLNVSGPSPEDLNAVLQQLDADRAWLLQQIDGGRWPELRLDLAAPVSYTHLTLPTTVSV